MWVHDWLYRDWKGFSGEVASERVLKVGEEFVEWLIFDQVIKISTFFKDSKVRE